MIVIKLDTPVKTDEGVIDEFKIETPIRAKHLLQAMRATTNSARMAELFAASVCGVSPGVLGELTIEDFAKVQSAISPFLASFNRLQSGAAS